MKAVRAPVAPAFIRSTLLRSAAMPEVAARLQVRLPAEELTVAVRLTGDRELRRLNRAFLGEDHPTDVLSFPSGDLEPHLGDIAISWPYTVRQAEAFGHAAGSELALLVVHGFLHLLGWDHGSAVEEAEMKRVTLGCLASAGVELGALRL